MKTNVMIMAMVLMGGAISAQQIEIDDMYFTAKDRAVVTSLREPKMKEQAKFLEESVPLNPTDSYSARNVNPEYISRAKMDPNSQVASSPYFIPNYQPVSVNQQINSITGRSFWNNTSSWNNPYNSIYGFNSVNPYSWMYPYNSWGFNNYYNSPWSSWLTMSMGFGYGGWNNWGSPAWNMWNNAYGWNSWPNNWGWNNGWNNWGFNSWANPWGMNSFYGYSPSIVVINNENSDRGVVNGKRVSRSSDYNNQVFYDNRNTSYVDNNGRSRGSNAGGRSDGGNTYYQRGWRSDPTTSGSGSGNVSGGRSSNSSWWSDSGDTNSGSNDRSWSNSNSRSSSGFSNSGSSFSTGGGGRSGGFTSGGSGGGAGGSSGGGRTRGRD